MTAGGPNASRIRAAAPGINEQRKETGNMPHTILVVDDEPDLQNLIRQKFRRQVRAGELEFHFAGDGLEALERLDEAPAIELVMTDINMPRMDGLELLRRIRGTDKLLRPVVVSAYGDMGNIRTAMNSGAYDFLTKPIDLQDLETTINKTLVEIEAQKQALDTKNRLEDVERELSLAAEIQQSILPKVFPPYPDREDIDIFARMIPARSVGGDFYDFFLVGDDRLALVIGDVSGKGAPAAIFASAARTIIKASALNGAAPDKCLSFANSMLLDNNNTNLFVTAFIAFVDLPTGRVEFSNAGHNPPFIVRAAGDVERIDPFSGIVLGIFAPVEFRLEEASLARGDSLVLYTDGVTEAMNGSDEEYTEARALAALRAAGPVAARTLLERLYEDVSGFVAGAPQSDDITSLAYRRPGAGA